MSTEHETIAAQRLAKLREAVCEWRAADRAYAVAVLKGEDQPTVLGLERDEMRALQRLRTLADKLSALDQPAPESKGGPIQLNAAQRDLCVEWAKDWSKDNPNGLFGNDEARLMNLQTFARSILAKAGAPESNKCAECERLRFENAELNRRLEHADDCDVCGGSGTHFSGKDSACLACMGTGRLSRTATTLREALYDTNVESERLRSALEEIDATTTGSMSMIHIQTTARAALVQHSKLR